MSAEKLPKSKRERQPDLNFIAPLSLEACQNNLKVLDNRAYFRFIKAEFSPRSRDASDFTILRKRKLLDNFRVEIIGQLRRASDSKTHVMMAIKPLWGKPHPILRWLAIIFNILYTLFWLYLFISMQSYGCAAALIFLVLIAPELRQFNRAMIQNEQRRFMQRIADKLDIEHGQLLDSDTVYFDVKPKRELLKEFRNLDEDDY